MSWPVKVFACSDEEWIAAAREKAAGIAEESRRAAGLSIMGPSTACAFIAEKIRKMSPASTGEA